MNEKDLIKLENTIDKLIDKELVTLTVSKPLSKDSEINKITIKPLIIREKLVFQISEFKNNQVFHNNYSDKESCKKLFTLISSATFGQLDAKKVNSTTTILTNKKGTLTIKTKMTESSVKDDSRFNHNRNKQYILNEGEKIDFLMALSVMTPDGRIAKAKFDKFKQLNRYLEFVRDILPVLSENKEQIHIVDFGCGKSYLTFALYYYLKKQLKMNVKITGLDLKESVISDCNALSKKLHYDDLQFFCGDIKDYETITGHKDSDIDMVITLHACDTATDYALYKAVKWNAKVIMAVPCCHKEMNRNLKLNNVDSTLGSLMKYGLIKERMTSLMTDAYRANCLEEQGYNVQILEFIDMEHTPKNILIRAVKEKNKMRQAVKSSELVNDNYGIKLTLGELLNLPPIS